MRRKRFSRRGKTRRRQIAAKSVFSVAVFSIVLVLMEYGARKLGPVTPGWRGVDPGTTIMVGHPTRLWGMGPGIRKNGDTTATIHAVGLREPLVPQDRPEGRERIMILGDSSFFGHGVRDHETVAVRLEKWLGERGVELDTVNGSIPGYSTVQTRILLEEVGWSFDPTVLVLGNLWSDNNFDHYPDQDLLYTQSRFRSVFLRSWSLLRLLAVAGDRLRGGHGAQIITWTRKSGWPEGGVRRVSVQRYARNLDLMVRAIHERGGDALIVAPANQALVQGNAVDRSTWEPYFQAQHSIAAHWGAPFVETTAVFREAMQRKPSRSISALFVDEMHPTPEGNDLMAVAIGQALQDAGWPDQATLADAG